MLCSPADWADTSFATVSAYILGTLHWLPVLIKFRIIALVLLRLLDLAPAYLHEVCCPVSAVVGCRFHSASSGELVVPCASTSTGSRYAI